MNGGGVAAVLPDAMMYETDWNRSDYDATGIITAARAAYRAGRAM
jgi:hypothetical protein